MRDGMAPAAGKGGKNMTEKEAYGQAFENGRKVGYEEGKRDAVKCEYCDAEDNEFRLLNAKTMV